MSDFEKIWQDYCAQHGTPDRIELMLCDINAILRGKWLPGEDIGKLTSGECYKTSIERCCKAVRDRTTRIRDTRL